MKAKLNGYKAKLNGYKMLKKWLILPLLLFSLINVGDARADEVDLFASVPPDAFILLDLSGSMDWLPMETDGIDYNTLKFYIDPAQSCSSSYDGPFYTSSGPGHTKECLWNGNDNTHWGSSTSNLQWGDAACLGPYYRTSGAGHDVSCAKINIAKRALFDLLDDNGDGVIDVNDITSLGVRLGYGSYYNGTYSLRWKITDPDNPATYPTVAANHAFDYVAPYSRIFCNNATSCTATYAETGETSIATSRANGGTPLGASMNTIKTYLDTHKNADANKSCRQKFAIVITDGSDTASSFGCSSTIQRRRYVVQQAKMLQTAGYKTFVVGVGANMPLAFSNTLEWMAYQGGTDNPSVANSGSTTAFDVAADVCAADATGNDPGTKNLSGYAFLASNSAQLTAALKYAFSLIKEATYSFSAMASVSASRVADENYIYEASFLPRNLEPFWRGNLKKYQIGADGSVGSVLWNAGSVLQGQAAAARSMWTYKGLGLGACTAFTTANILPADLNVGTTALRDSVVGFFRGEAAYNIENWKLGDIFRSNPVAVGTPTSYFFDPRQTSAASFTAFRTAHIRTSNNGKRLILVGANDGQLHAFRTGNGADPSSGGDEVWSFIPPNLLHKLASIAHNVDPSGLGHQFFVDGQVQVSDAWLPAVAGTGVSKAATDWKTLAIFSLGKDGAGDYLWSSSASCHSTSAADFSGTWSATYNQYCGYHALDVTDTMTSLQPTYAWHLMNLSATQGPYLGKPYGNKMQIGRVKMGTNEKWVGFIGGGYESTACPGACTSSTDKKGKGFFVVDLKDGAILWKYTNADNTTLSFSVAATPLVVDLDNDGFMDTVYVGDLGGNMWRFRLCSKNAAATCTTTNWSGSLLYQAAAGERPKYIYNQASTTTDTKGNIWVYFGTGDKIDPVALTGTNRLFAIKEHSDFTGTHTTSDLENISSSTYADSDTKHGWYINLPGTGEKILSDIKVFGGNIFFTTYLPDTSGDQCLVAGSSKLYSMNYLTGLGTIDPLDASNPRSKNVGTGIASSPVISIDRTRNLADLYVTTSGGGGIGAVTSKAFSPPMSPMMTNMLYWRDRRVQ